MELPTIQGGRGPRFRRLTGVAAPLMMRDVDADAITSRPGPRSEPPRAFDRLRSRPDGSEDRDFVLNRREYRDASILITGDNFGTGGAGEAAAGLLMESGIRSILATSFDPTFYACCLQFGILPVTLSEEAVEELAARVAGHPGVELTIDLEEQVIEVPEAEPLHFDIHPRARNKLLLGLTDLDEMLQHEEDLAALRKLDRSRRPWMYDTEE